MNKRRLLSDFNYILFKEMASPGHATGSQQLQTVIAEAAVRQLLAPGGEEERIMSRVRVFGDGGVF